jgi:SAM-dependent methyltransferase
VHEGVYELLSAYVPPPAQVLDLAAGSGAFARRLLDAGYQVHAADIDLEGWSVQDVPISHVDCNCDVWDLPMKNFSAIVAIELIEHLENPTQFLRVAQQHLDQGGVLIFTTPNVVSLQSRRRIITTGEFAFFGRHLLFTTGHRSLLPFWLAEDLLTSQGYSLLERRFIGHQGMILRPGRRAWMALIVPLIDLLLMVIGRRIPREAGLMTAVAYVAGKGG